MQQDPDDAFNAPVIYEFGPEYGSKQGQRVQVEMIKYSLSGPAVFFPGLLK